MTPPTTVRSSTARSIATAAVTALAPVTVVAARALLGDEVPDPLPTHWDLHGVADDTTPLLVLFVATLAMSTLFSVLTLLAVRQSRQQHSDRVLVTAASWAAWLAATVFLVPAWVSAGAASASDVGIGALAVLAIPLVPTVMAGLVWSLQRVVPPASASPVPASSLRLRDGERVTWVGRSSSGRILVLAGVLLVMAVFLVFTVWPVAGLLALVAVVLFWMNVLSVRVDDEAVTVAWGVARWPRIVVPLEQIVGARAEHVDPLRWGGWGYRVTLRGTAAVTRGGPGLVLDRRDRSPFAVTVDRPEAAADLVNALVERGSRIRSSR